MRLWATQDKLAGRGFEIHVLDRQYIIPL